MNTDLVRLSGDDASFESLLGFIEDHPEESWSPRAVIDGYVGER
jgi:hypothetical protein